MELVQYFVATVGKIFPCGKLYNQQILKFLIQFPQN